MPSRPRGARSIEQILTGARARLVRLTPQWPYREVSGDGVLIDIRPAAQRADEGEIPGSAVIERNHLEWRLDPASAARLPWVTGYDHRIIVICQEGFTSSLAAAALHDLGLHQATDVVGGFRAWTAGGLPSASAAAGTVTLAAGAAPAWRPAEPAPAAEREHGRALAPGRLPAVRVQLGEAVPGQVDQVGGDLFQLGLTGIEPPLPGERDHADQHLSVQGGELGVVVAGGEEVGQDVLDLAGDIAEQCAVRAGARTRIRVPDQDAEAVGVVVDVPEQGHRGRLEFLPAVIAVKERGRHRQQALHLPVHDDRVETLLAAEVLVHHRLRDVGLRRDLLDRGPFEPSLGEQPATDV